MPNVNLATYAQDLHAATIAMTDVLPANAGRRVQRTNSQVIQNVVVISGNSQVTLRIAESGLYVKAFVNAHGTYWFAGENNGAGNQLHFGCSYVGNNNIGIFTSPGPTPDTQAARSLHSIDQAVRDLAAFNGGNDAPLKLKLAMVIFLSSESIRFSSVYKKMVKVCEAGETYTFEQFRDWVQSWQGITDGLIPAGTNQAQLFTWHH